MSKLALFRTTFRSNLAVRTIARRFSTEPEPPSSQDSHDSGSRSAYLRLYGVGKNTLRTDISNMLEGCNVTEDDIRAEYDYAFNPKSMLVQLPSANLISQANKMIMKKGRLYRTDRVDQAQWDTLAPYEGKAVLLQGIPQMAAFSDLERFLHGCNFYDNTVRLFFRAGFQGKIAIVRFPSQYDAMNCFIAKNKSFCLNGQVQIRVLQ